MSRKSMFWSIIAGSLSIALAAPATASVTQYYGTQITSSAGTTSFDNPGFSVTTGTYSEGGMSFWMFGDDAWGGYTGCNGDNSGGYYSNGGGHNPTQIIRTDAQDFDAVEFQFYDGWGQCVNYGYAEIYLNNVLVGAFDIDGNANSTIVGFKGTFDEVRVAFYYSAADRDQHNLNSYSAGGIDQVNYGTVNQSPIITCGDTAVLWSPNHELNDISASLFTVDDPDGDDVTVTYEVLSEESETPETGDGTGRHAPDFKSVLADGSEGFFLRSERQGPGDGRVYLVVVTADDGAESVTQVCVAAVVPHDEEDVSLAAVLAEAALRAADLQVLIDALGPGNVDYSALGLGEHGVADELGKKQ